jgi:hypothetical protein
MHTSSTNTAPSIRAALQLLSAGVVVIEPRRGVDSAERKAIFTPCLERWENEGGAHLDEHSIKFSL